MYKNYYQRRREEYSEYLKSEHWRELRDRKLKQVGGKCQICGSTRGLQVHHKKYDNLGSENLWDLRVLCGNCHSGTHYDLADEREGKYQERVHKRQEDWERGVFSKISFYAFAILFGPFAIILYLFEKLKDILKNEYEN